MIDILISIQAPPVDYMDPSLNKRPLSFMEHVMFDRAFLDKRLPRLSDVKRMEKTLSQFPCLRPLARWHRGFAYARNASTLRIDKDLIEFNFATPHSRWKAGRYIVKFGELYTVDDGFFDTAHGVYSIRTHLATLTYCGPNHAPAR